MKKYYCLLVDWDGTIVDSIPFWVRTIHGLLIEYSIFLSPIEILEQVYGKEKGVQTLGIEDYKTFNQSLFERIQNNYYTIPLFPFVAETLTRIHQKGVSISIVSNTKKNFIMDALNFHSIDGAIDLIVGREEVSALKPAPEAVLYSIHKMSCEKSRSIIVGDSVYDLEAGRNSGIDTVLFSPKSDFNNLALKPTYIINNFKELMQLLIEV
jgi:phosphoglycolate phosphatase-like HAD superfamily hydrolase